MLKPTEPKRLSLRARIALELAKQGFWIFPLKVNGKTPAIGRWPERATTDSATIEKWWSEKDYNIGIATGPAPRISIVNTGDSTTKRRVLIVVDYDMKPGQSGEKALKSHILLGYSDTLTVKTPNGIHKYYWFDVDDVTIPNSVSRIAPNVDVRGLRGCVVGPGSIIDGVEYQVVSDEKDPIAFPDELARLAMPSANNPSGPLEHHKAPVGPLDHPSAIAAAKRYLINDAPEAIEGSGGDLTTYRVAATIKDMGLSEGEALGLMLDHWNEEKAHRPWSPDELRQKVQNAYRYGQSAPGSKDPLVEFDVETSESGDPQVPPKPDAKGRLPLEPEDFKSTTSKARTLKTNPLVAGIIGRGELCAIYGPPGAAKTFVALDLAHAVATGRDWGGKKTTQGAVLYVAAEGGPAIRARFLALQTRYPEHQNPPLFLLRYPIDFRTGEYDAARLVKLIEQLQHDLGIRFLMVFLDTLAETLAGGNDNEHMQQFVHNAKFLQMRTGTTVVPVHHPGKDANKGMRGHSSLIGAVDTALEITAPQGSAKGARRYLRVTKQRNLEIPAQPSRFVLDVLDLGLSDHGDALSSCVVVWEGSAPDEFASEIVVELSASEKTLAGVIERWALDQKCDRDTVGPAGLLEWLKAKEPGNALAVVKYDAMQKALNRLRTKGALLGDVGESREDDLT